MSEAEPCARTEPLEGGREGGGNNASAQEAMTARPLRIGTRGSPLALAQAGLVRDRLLVAHPELAGLISLIPIRTSADRLQSRPLAEFAGKGLFTKEIEEALLERRIDCAVHSMKDLAATVPDGLEVAAVLAREDARDAFISGAAESLSSLPSGARVGTSSPRRKAQILFRRPDLSIVPFRGNIGTRMKKLGGGEADATLLAFCGLLRLGFAGLATEILSPEIMLPAVGQGALAVEYRAGEEALKALLAPIEDPQSAFCVYAERAMLAALGGSCKTPIGALASLEGERLILEGALFKPDGTGAIRLRHEGGKSDWEALGGALAAELKSRGGADYGFD